LTLFDGFDVLFAIKEIGHMPVMETLSQILDDNYFNILENAVVSGDYSAIENRLEELKESDTHAHPYSGERGTKYYKPFVQSLLPKIIPALQRSLPNDWPEIKISLSELDSVRRSLGIPNFGSPQDVLYGFTSERYKNWGGCLNGMGFTSACMIGQGEMVITMAPRYLIISKPDIVVSEIGGAISKDFWESVEYIFNKDSFYEILQDVKLCCNLEFPEGIESPDEDTCEELNDYLGSVVAEESVSSALRIKAEALQFLLEEVLTEPNNATRRQKTLALLRSSLADVSVSQEQISLKYMEEGKYLQKLLNGSRVEHLQSNVKMVKNPLRGNKCEVDSIYRVIGEKKFVFVEAKARDYISRTQIYQLYETFRLRIPSDWDISVVALMKSSPSEEQSQRNIKDVIDLVEIHFDESKLGNITESLFEIKPKKHYRWEII
jgi:hypothetical protein